MARMNLNDVKEYGKRALIRAFLATRGPLGCERVIPNAITARYSIYEDIVRKSQELFNVGIYYDPFCPSQGLYIVGRKSSVEECGRWLVMIIQRVEKDVSQFGRNTRSKVHGNEARSNYAHKKVRQILVVQAELIQAMYDLYYDGSVTTDNILLTDWAKQVSVIKNKTKYHGELRNDGANHG